MARRRSSTSEKPVTNVEAAKRRLLDGESLSAVQLKEEGLGTGKAVKVAAAQLRAEGHAVRSWTEVLRTFPHHATLRYQLVSPAEALAEDRKTWTPPRTKPKPTKSKSKPTPKRGQAAAELRRRLLDGETVQRSEVGDGVAYRVLKRLRNEGYRVASERGWVRLVGFGVKPAPVPPAWVDAPEPPAAATNGTAAAHPEVEVELDAGGHDDFGGLLRALPPIGDVALVTMHALLDDGGVALGVRYGPESFVLRVIARERTRVDAEGPTGS